MNKSDTYKTIFLASIIITFVGLTFSTDLTNIESIFPQGDSVSIEGDLAMNGNSILSFFESSCSSGEIVVGVNDDGSYDCVDVSDEVSGDYVDRDGDTMTGTLDMTGENIEDVDELRSSDLVINRRLDSSTDEVDRWFWLLGEWGSRSLNTGGNIFGERTSGHDDIRLIDFGFSSSSDGPEDRYKAYINYNVGGRGGPFEWGMARVDYDGTEYLALYYEGNRFWDSGTYFTGQLMDTPGVNQDEVFTNVLTSDDVDWNGEISYEGVDRVLKQETLDVRGDARFTDDVNMDGNDIEDVSRINVEDGFQVPVGEDAW